MKILHINCNYIGTALHQIMMNHFNNESLEHSVFCPTYNKELSVITPNENVCVAECFNQWDRICFGYKQNKIINRLQIEYDIASFDCIHAYTLFTDGNAAMILSKKYGVPYVVAVRDTDINSFLKWKPYLKYKAMEILQQASAVFFLSESYRKALIEEYVPHNLQKSILVKSRIIPNGIDDFWHNNVFGEKRVASEQRVRNHELRVAFVGRINKRKNVLMTQRALNILRSKGWKVSFHFAGGIEDNKLFDAVVRCPDTQYLGKLGKERLLDLYREVDLFVMPSYTETFGLVYVEAMSQGLPVVYTKGQGFDMQFEEGVVGYHVNADSPEEIAEGIEKICSDYKTIQSNVIGSIEKYRWRSIVEQYEKIYQEVVE